jgi:uracil permease
MANGSNNGIIDVDDRLSIAKTIPLSLQHLFAMVGSTILVPILVGLNPSIALLCGGIGTLLYILCTKAKLPAYLGSSFAFIAPIGAVLKNYGQGAALVGCISSGVIYLIVALIIYFFGTSWIHKVFPPVVIGSVIMVIGLMLAKTAVGMAGFPTDGSANYNWPVIFIAAFTLIVAAIGSVYFKGFLGVIPILMGIIAGYILSIFMSVYGGYKIPIADTAITHKFFDIKNIVEANLFAMPKFAHPTLDSNSLAAIISIAPIAVITIIEHIGHVLVTNSVCNKDFTKEPGLHRSILGDGIATIVAGCLGGPPTTTYGENIGVMAITKVYSVWVIGGAGVIAIILSFVGTLSAIIKNIPTPVVGGVSILLFGVIASSGLRTLVENAIDYADKRNLIITSVILILGIGGASLQFTSGKNVFLIDALALSTLVGIILNLIMNIFLPEKEEIK